MDWHEIGDLEFSWTA